jgi:ribosomal protein S12 methylthiotransferase accessory factor
VKGYCDARSIATDGLGLVMHVEREPGKARVARLVLEITLPPGFPDTHREAVVRTADLCAVKKSILDPPTFEIRTV